MSRVTPWATSREIADILAKHLGLDPARILSADLMCRAGQVPTWEITIVGGPEPTEIAHYGLMSVPPAGVKEVGA